MASKNKVDFTYFRRVLVNSKRDKTQFKGLFFGGESQTKFKVRHIQCV